MNILALDIGTKTGFCAGTTASHVSGVWNLKPSRFDSASMRLVRLLAQLNEIHTTMKLERVYYEEVRRHMGVDAAHWYGGLSAQIILWADQHELPHEGVPVGTIKRAFTGKGNASKHEMIAEAARRGYAVTDENEADAIALFLLKSEESVAVARVATVAPL